MDGLHSASSVDGLSTRCSTRKTPSRVFTAAGNSLEIACVHVGRKTPAGLGHGQETQGNFRAAGLIPTE